MKRIFFLAVIVIFSQAAIAQVNPDSVPKLPDTSINKSKYDKYKGDYITMQGGQVIMVKEGKASKLTMDKLLKDGTIVSKEGKITKKDGTVSEMKEGDRVYVDGGMILSSKDPIK